MVDISVSYLGLDLRSPLVASSSPMTSDLDGLRRLEDGGIAAVVLPSLFEEEIEHYAVEVSQMLTTGAESHDEALNYFPGLHDYDTGPDRYLELIASAKAALDIPVIASLNGVTKGWWTEFAGQLQTAGADAIELNEYHIAADPEVSGVEIERRHLEVVREVVEAVRIPVAIKVGPYFSSFANMAAKIAEAGADGLVLFNRFRQPDIDLDSLTVAPRLVLSDSGELRLPLRWIALLRSPLANISLAATTGIHTAEDALKALLAGADVTMMASALIKHGHQHIGRMERSLVEWLDDNEYPSITVLQGSVSADAAIDPSAYARANYVEVLRSYSTPTT